MAIYVRDESGVLQTLRIPAYKGEKGEAGITPNIQIGDVITLESGQQATVVRRGDDENPIFDFAIPKGEDGKDGIFVGSIDDAPEHAQIVINDDPSPYDLFYEDANVSYMGDTYTSLKEKADADIEYLLRKFGTQHYEGSNITATDTYQKQVKSAILKGVTKYRDKDTGEILEAFEEGRNLELISVRMPVLTTMNEYPNYHVKEDIGNFISPSYVDKAVCWKLRIKTDKDTFLIKEGDEWAFKISYSNTNKKLDVYHFNMDTGIISTSLNNVDLTSEKDINVLIKNNRISIWIDGVNRLNEFRLSWSRKSKTYYSGELNELMIFENLSYTDTSRPLSEFKTNILTTPQDLELRGIGDVCDTVDLVTGKKVERIGEIVLDDTLTYEHGWRGQYDTDNEYVISARKVNHDWTISRQDDNSNLICDKLRVRGMTSFNGFGYLIFYVNKNELSDTSVTTISDYIVNLAPKFQYVKTPTAKSIDLQNQKIYSYDDTTHYTTVSAQGHSAPILSIDVPTNTTKMIAHQREEIEQQEQKLQEQEEVQNLLIESQLAWYEDNVSTLELTDEDTPSHIQKLYGLTRKCKVGEE